MPFENLSSGLLFNSWIEIISDAYRRATATTNVSTQAITSSTGLSPLSTTSALMSTKKDGISTDGQIKGFDGKKRD
ncbi:unnamed protein product [Rotaria sp. Silwood1]|nr:unnamed protein product [Rotaria sp. Silwood1]CAF1686701.1 unnamed protein product [Rotaria sp. Silwood1]